MNIDDFFLAYFQNRECSGDEASFYVNIPVAPFTNMV